ncbi:hypothetical protein KDH83_29565 [Achromobacter sp. Marseille-Q0513]|uniref:VHL beta domain-containing protein n=1 Tax=Achromobacter sp. Marseille-Q0513 TaxID=2829161 RepID=UPI001BA0E5AB|nr:hypothetical protein [Achromobacter sp. Marseille-Q0513]MBR8657470.1 hypothetical protein [Achromobacter sp. Marseille-Q0513]
MSRSAHRQTQTSACLLAVTLGAAVLALPAASHALSPATHAERTPCAGEGKTLRSHDAARPTQIEFINHGKEIKTIYWLNYEGRRVYYTRLQPGDSYIQKTYVSHPWVVTSDDLGTCETAVLPVRTPSITILN